MSVVQSVAVWVDQRIHLTKLLESTAGHKVPASAHSWWYALGSATLTCLIIQIVTGICLSFVYVPSASQAFTSLEYLNYEQPLGWFIRAVHNHGSNFMVGLMTLHMVQTFLFGAYKYPREMTWIVGVFLFLCVLGMAFTGQVLRWDQDAYWGLGIGVAMMGRFPFIGQELVHLVLAGPIIGAETLSRFFTLHVFVIPGVVIALIAVHLRLVLTAGINEYPEPGKLVDRATYPQRYREILDKDGVPFYPKAVSKDLIFSAVVIVAILACAAIFGPKGPNGVPDPTLIHTVPRPDFYFLSLFAVFALLPPYMETFLILTAPVVGIALLIALPFLSGTGEKSYLRRPVAILSVVLIFMTLGVLTYLGESSPWSPHMEAWSGVPTPVQYVKGRSPLELQGALLIQGKQCRNCHALDGKGGQRGPDLTGVANRLSEDQLIRQVLQGGGNMPAYGKHLEPAEVTALVAFMRTLHPPLEPPARSSQVPAKPEG